MELAAFQYRHLAIKPAWKQPTRASGNPRVSVREPAKALSHHGAEVSQSPAPTIAKVAAIANLYWVK